MGSNPSGSRWCSIRDGCIWRIVIAVPWQHHWRPYGSYPHRDSAAPTALSSTNCPPATSRPPSPVSHCGTSDSMRHAHHESLPVTAANQGAVAVCLPLPREDYRFVFATDRARFAREPRRQRLELATSVRGSPARWQCSCWHRLAEQHPDSDRPVELGGTRDANGRQRREPLQCHQN